MALIMLRHPPPWVKRFLGGSAGFYRLGNTGRNTGLPGYNLKASICNRAVGAVSRRRGFSRRSRCHLGQRREAGFREGLPAPQDAAGAEQEPIRNYQAGAGETRA